MIVQAFIVCLVSTVSCLMSDEIVLPMSSKKSLAGLPTLSDLFKEERTKNNKASRKATEEVLQTVLLGSENEQEKKAQALAQNQEKLSEFLDTLPSMMPKNGQSKPEISIEQSLPSLASEINDLLSAQFDTELLRETTVTISLKEVALHEAIELISKSTKLNFIIDSAVVGRITLAHFFQAPLSQVLKSLLAQAGSEIALLHEKNIFRILPYKKAKKVLQSRAHQLWESSLVSAKRTLQHIQMSESVKLRIEKMWENLTRGQRSSGHYLLCEDGSKQVFMRGKKKFVEVFCRFLQDIDVALPQVKIDARVVLASHDFERSWGLQWSHLFNRRSSVCNDFEMIGSGPLEDIRNCPKPQSKCNLFDWAMNLFPPTAMINRTLKLPLVFGGSDLDTKRLNIVLNAAENQGDVQTLLKPSLLSAHKETAEILVGSRVPIETVVKETIEGTLRDITTATYIDVGTKLKIKPLISPDKKQVFLDIYVENSCLNGCCGKFPIIRTTRAHNRVVLGSGQTTLIGGLIESNRNNENNALPVLGQIPLFGWLFKGVRKVKKESQLLIFLTPTII